MISGTALFQSDGSATTSVRSDFAVYHGHRNLVWTWFKDMPMVLLWLFLPMHVLYTFACIVPCTM